MGHSTVMLGETLAIRLAIRVRHSASMDIHVASIDPP